MIFKPVVLFCVIVLSIVMSAGMEKGCASRPAKKAADSCPVRLIDLKECPPAIMGWIPKSKADCEHMTFVVYGMHDARKILDEVDRQTKFCIGQLSELGKAVRTEPPPATHHPSLPTPKGDKVKRKKPKRTWGDSGNYEQFAVGSDWILQQQPPTTIPQPPAASDESNKCIGFNGKENVALPCASDDSPIQEEYGPLGFNWCDMGACHFEPGVPSELGIKAVRQTRLTCADKTRVLLIAEDGTKYCIKVPIYPPDYKMPKGEQ